MAAPSEYLAGAMAGRGLAWSTSPDVVRLLLEAGADPNVAMCAFGAIWTPLTTADTVGLQEEADLLRAAGAYEFRSGAEFALSRSAFQGSLDAAVWEGDVDAVERLLQAGSDPNAVIEGVQFADGRVDRYTPLNMALMGGFDIDADWEPNIDLVRLLLEAGADPNEYFEIICANSKPAPLLIATMGGDAELLDVLLQAGADPNVASLLDGSSFMPLHMAAASGSIEMVQLLLNAGADPNAVVEVDGGRYAPLDVATMEGHSEVAAILRAAGAEEASVPPDAEVYDAFGGHFGSCTPGSTFTASLPEPGAGVRYDILGPEGDGCRISMTYTSNPNPAWENKPLLLTLDSESPFLEQLRDGMEACMGGGDARFDCGGPLLEVLRP